MSTGTIASRREVTDGAIVDAILATVPRAGGAVRLGIDRHGVASQLTCGPAGRAVWIESHSDWPDELYAADHPALVGARVTDFNITAAHTRLGDTRVVHWTSTDGVRVEGVVVRPTGQWCGSSSSLRRISTSTTHAAPMRSGT